LEPLCANKHKLSKQNLAGIMLSRVRSVTASIKIAHWFDQEMTDDTF
jgi:hypothetical protein